MKTKIWNYVIYLVTTVILCSLITGSFAATGYNCPSETDYRNVLSKAIVDYLTNPDQSKLKDDEIRDMLDFYLKNEDVSKADCTQGNINALLTVADENIPDSVIKNLGKQAIEKWSKCKACSDDTGCGSKNDVGQTCVCIEADGDSADYESCVLRPIIPEPEVPEPCNACDDKTPCGKKNNNGETCECMLATTDGKYRFCILEAPAEPCTGCGNLKCGEKDDKGYTCECREGSQGDESYKFCFLRRTTIPCTECVTTTEKIACGKKNDKGAECVCNYALKEGGFKECRLQIGPEKSCKSDKDCPSSTESAEQFCEFPTGTCGGEGKCVVKPTSCQSTKSPVCGCDQMTHPNDCFRKGTGTSKLYDGECGTCIPEGGRMAVVPGSPGCCEGLEAVSIYSIVDGQCMANTGGSVCVNCGNGQCEPGEDYCNCKEDCLVNESCKAGEEKKHYCPDQTEVDWCKCTKEGKWECINSPETQCTQTKCTAGEVKKHYCPDQTEVDWCKCTKEGKWECINSPETQCTQTKCTAGEVKKHYCPDQTQVDWCKCNVNGTWDCITNPEKQCSIGSCSVGDLKYHTCPGGKKVEWCKCAVMKTSTSEESAGEWECVNPPSSLC